MGHPVDFVGSNLTLGPPKGMTEEEVRTMPVFQGNGFILSCWQLSPDELAEINKTGKVWLSVMGNGAPPTFVGSETENLKMIFPAS